MNSNTLVQTEKALYPSQLEVSTECKWNLEYWWIYVFFPTWKTAVWFIQWYELHHKKLVKDLPRDYCTVSSCRPQLAIRRESYSCWISNSQRSLFIDFSPLSEKETIHPTNQCLDIILTRQRQWADNFRKRRVNLWEPSGLKPNITNHNSCANKLRSPIFSWLHPVIKICGKMSHQNKDMLSDIKSAFQNNCQLLMPTRLERKLTQTVLCFSVARQILDNKPMNS